MQETVLRWFDSWASPGWDAVFTALTYLGEETFAIAMVAFVYWNLSPRTGMFLGMTVLFSVMINQVLKLVFAVPRPFEVLAGIEGKRIETAYGYAFPSGHTQTAATIFTALALLVGRRWFWIISVVLAVLVGVSRLYLGVHWPLDVVGGLALGLGLAFAFWALFRWIGDSRPRMALAMGWYAGALLLIAGAVEVLEMVGTLAPSRVIDFWKAIGVSLGAVAGFALQKAWVKFSPAGSLVWKLFRWVLGITIAIGLLVGLKTLLPTGALFDGTRYALVGIWITVGYPGLGMLCRIFQPQRN